MFDVSLVISKGQEALWKYISLCMNIFSLRPLKNLACRNKSIVGSKVDQWCQWYELNQFVNLFTRHERAQRSNHTSKVQLPIRGHLDPEKRLEASKKVGYTHSYIESCSCRFIPNFLVSLEQPSVDKCIVIRHVKLIKFTTISFRKLFPSRTNINLAKFALATRQKGRARPMCLCWLILTCIKYQFRCCLAGHFALRFHVTIHILWLECV